MSEIEGIILVIAEVLVSQLRIGGHEFHKEEHTYRKGDRLTLPEDYAKKLGTSLTIIGPVPEPTPPEIPQEPAAAQAALSELDPDQEPIADLGVIASKDAIDHLKTVQDKSKLERYLNQELSGKNRKTVIEAIEEQLSE